MLLSALLCVCTLSLCSALPLTMEEIDEMERLDKNHLRIATVIAPPFAYESKVVGKEGKLKGFLVDLIDELKTRLNFTYELYLVPDGKFGMQDKETGEWNGLIGELISDKADMALAPFTISRRRSQVIRFGEPYMEAGIVPLIQRPTDGTQMPFRDLIDLVVNRKNIEYGALKGGSTFQLFNNSKYPLFAAMGQFMREHEEDVMARDIEEAAARVREGRYVYLGEEPMLHWLAHREPCDLLVLGQSVITRSYAFGFQKDDSRTANVLSWELMSMKEDGTFQMLYRKHFKRDCKAPRLCVCSAHSGGNSTIFDEFDSGEADEAQEKAEESAEEKEESLLFF